MKILIIEDTQDLATSLVRFLATKDISAEMCLNWEDGLYKASIKYYDAIVLDINLPEKDGLTVCRELREKWKDVPIIMLTSRSSNDDIITGLDAWADDYLVKPFDYEVLTARLEALTRRNLKNKSTSKLTIWNYEIDLEKIQVRNIAARSFSPKGEGWDEGWRNTWGGEIIHLSQTEFDLFKYFAQNLWKVISRQELYEKVWWEFDGDFMFSKTVDVYIGYLRKKLGREIIETKKGHGYIVN